MGCHRCGEKTDNPSGFCRNCIKDLHMSAARAAIAHGLPLRANVTEAEIADALCNIERQTAPSQWEPEAAAVMALLRERQVVAAPVWTQEMVDDCRAQAWDIHEKVFGAPAWSGPTRAEAEAKIAAQGGGWHDRFVALTDWLLPLLPKTAAAGWELDVTESELSAWIDAMDDGEFCLDHFIDLIKSRIRTAECKECKTWQDMYTEKLAEYRAVEAAVGKTYEAIKPVITDAARAALEGE